MANEIDVVSTDASGNSLAYSNDPSISADGTLVAFSGQSPGGSDLEYGSNAAVYIRDLETGDLRAESTASDGTLFPNAYGARISADGGSLAFVGYTTLPHNFSYQVYEKDLATGDLTLVSQAADGTAGNDNSGSEAISAHGRFVAFDSQATNLLPGVSDYGDSHVYVRDMQTGDLRLVSTNADGDLENGTSSLDSMSAGGRLIAFTSTADNLVPGVPSGFEVYVKNMRIGAVTLAAQTADGVPANGHTYDASLSANGREVAFMSDATNLVIGAGGTHFPQGGSDVYVKNLVTGDLVLASSAADGTPADDGSYSPHLSPDGRYVMFFSYATNLVPGVTSGQREVYVKDLETGAVALLSQDSSGNPSSFSDTSGSTANVFSGDDTGAVFYTDDSNLTGLPPGYDAAIATKQSAPDLELNPVAGNGFVGPRKATHPVLISGTSTELGQQVSVSLDGASSPLGTATVQDDGTWRFRASLDGITPGDHTVLATVQSQPSYLSYPPATASETFVYQPSEAPSLSSTSTDAIGPQNVGSAFGSPPPFVYTDHTDMGSSPLPGDGQPSGTPFVSLAAASHPAAFDGSGGQNWLKPNHA